MTVYGRSPGGRIHHNRVYLNMSFDEGGGIMIAGQLPANPDDLSPGSGSVDIYANEIKANLANDDGGGVRFLMAGGSGGTDQMNVVNNVIADNVSTHEGGGISLNDAPNVRVVNNTIMKNLTTATAATSNGQPAPAGLSTSGNSDLLQATLPAGAPTFSDPVLFNNIFWDNRAGARTGTTVTGIGLAGDAGSGRQLGPRDVRHPGPALPDELGGPAERGRARLPRRRVEQRCGSPGRLGRTTSRSASRPGDRTLPSSTPRWSRSTPRRTSWATTTSPAAPRRLRATWVRRPRVPSTPPATDLDDQVRPALGGFDAGADEFGASLPVPNGLLLLDHRQHQPAGRGRHRRRR